MASTCGSALWVDEHMGEDPNKPEVNAGAMRRRSIAIALLLFAMVAMFYAATIIRFGNNMPPQGM